MLECRPGSISSGYSPDLNLFIRWEHILRKVWVSSQKVTLCCAGKRSLTTKCNYFLADSGLGKRSTGNRPRISLRTKIYKDTKSVGAWKFTLLSQMRSLLSINTPTVLVQEPKDLTPLWWKQVNWLVFASKTYFADGCREILKPNPNHITPKFKILQ